MFYINQSIPCKKIETFQFTSSTEILTLEINLGKEKLLIFGTYKPPNINNISFLNELYNAITFNSTLYKNCVLLGDLNIVQDNTQLQNFVSLSYLNTLSRNQLATRVIPQQVLTILLQTFQNFLWNQWPQKLASQTIIKWSWLFPF